jgi:hypothetical protein
MTTAVHERGATTEAVMFPRNKYTLMNPRHMIKRYEIHTGGRYCTGCQAMVPLGKFPHPQKYAPRHFVCKLHHSQAKEQKTLPVEKTPVEKEVRIDRKAAMLFRAAARKDKVIFGHDSVNITPDETQALLKKEHLDNPAAFAMLPIKPMEPISKENAILVSSAQRRYLTGMWKATHDPQAYERDMATLLNVGSP